MLNLAKEYKAGVYLRISKEDKEKKNSISSQKAIVEKYAKDHNYEIVEEYIDNGYSGILSSRPALDKMMLDIVRKQINMVIVKDTSRLTRDKNLTSYFTDIFFPDNDIRFISVTEYVDTGERYDIDDMVALRGIINQSYLDDISKKIKAVKTEFKKQGKFIENSVPYGYKKDSNNKYQLVIDIVAADVIKEIFSLYLEGIKPFDIAKELNNRNIKTPSVYQNLNQKAKCWTNKIVSRILANPVYTGRLPINKYSNDYKQKKTKVTPNNKLEFCENTHEPIISIDDFEEVQRRRASRTKNERTEYLYLLKDLVYCNNCGCKLTYKNDKPLRRNSKGIILGKKNENGRFVCEEHARNKSVCKYNDIKITEKALNEIVLKRVSKRLKEIQIEKYGSLVESEVVKAIPAKSDEKKLKMELDKQEKYFKILYTKKVEGIISEDEFLEKYNVHQNKINEIKEELDSLGEKNKMKNFPKQVNKLIIDFSDTKKFDNTMLKKFVEKIEVNRNNKIDIFLKV